LLYLHPVAKAVESAVKKPKHTTHTQVHKTNSTAAFLISTGTQTSSASLSD